MLASWAWGLAGGLLIGSAAALYLLVNGRVMGMSGILGGLVDGTGWGTWAERLAFVAGVVVVPGLLALAFGGTTHLTGNWLVIVLGGLLVGLGTRVSNGCTSGHGICGLGSLQWPSALAALTFLATAMLTANLVTR